MQGRRVGSSPIALHRLVGLPECISLAGGSLTRAIIGDCVVVSKEGAGYTLISAEDCLKEDGVIMWVRMGQFVVVVIR